MSARHRFFRNEYKSFNMTSSQFSPETSLRSQSHALRRADNSRGNFRRFHPKSFPPRKNDLFIEAGRLAVDYLISHQLLSPNVCSLSSSSNGNSWKISNTPDFRDPALLSGRGRPEHDPVDDDEASGGQRRRRKSPCGRSTSRGDRVDKCGRVESSSLPVKANDNASPEVGTDGDAKLSSPQLQQDGEDADNRNISKSDSTLKVKDESGAAGEKLADDSASSMREDGNDLLRTVKIDASNDASDSTCHGEFIAPVQSNTLTHGHSAGISASKVHNSMDKDKCEKQALGGEDTVDNIKKAKVSFSVSSSHEDLQLSEQEVRPAPGTLGIEAVTQKEGFDSVSMHSKGDAATAGPAMLYSEEKQLFPCSFRICDLNLMEASDNNNESHDNPSISYSSISVPGKQVSVDVDLSMGNSCVNNEYNKYKPPEKAVEVIDLEGDSLDGDKNFHSSVRRVQSGFTSLENFPNHAQNSSYNPDAQDGYGLMISELIGNDIPNCPSVQLEINTLHSDMGLHHGDGLLTDDDPIYMSLGEIPSLLRGWDQPTQDYGKSF